MENDSIRVNRESVIPVEIGYYAVLSAAKLEGRVEKRCTARLPGLRRHNLWLFILRARRIVSLSECNLGE